MDLARVSNERKLYLCKWYFRAGFLLLPFLWAVNAIWFAKEAFIAPEYQEQKQIKKCNYKNKLFSILNEQELTVDHDVILSGIGALLWIAALLAWIITFQTQRAAWGEYADAISYIIPAGIP